MNKEKDLQKIKALATGEQCNIFWFEEGGGVVYKVYDRLILFEVPQYGGHMVYENTFHISEAEKLVNLVYTWT
jgi:hypothetical protein